MDYADHLNRQDIAVQAFVDILRRERDALAVRPPTYAALAEITDAKTRQAEALEHLERKRRAMAEAARARAGTELNDAEIAHEFGCGGLWARFSAHVAQVRNQNMINGVAINIRLDYTEARLDFLSRNASESLYAANGQRRPAGGTGRLRGDA